jgi:uncharacterized protein (TIGR04255 family)
MKRYRILISLGISVDRMTKERTLPDFDDPPVVETALGLEFAPLRWSVPHFGLFWSEIREEYPRHQVQPPLDSVVERFGDDPRNRSGLQIQFLRHPLLRCWFFDRSNSRLLQIQPDRFIHNWRKQDLSDQYPHYENIWPIFEREWHRFCEFAMREEVGQPKVTQCEVTYVNQIERGPAWMSLADLGRVLTFWNESPSSSFLPPPEATLAKMAFVLPNLKARLHVELQLAIRNSDLKEVLQLTLTARGQPESGDLPDVRTWMDRAREAVVQSFVDLTTQRMHQLWRRKV